MKCFENGLRSRAGENDENALETTEKYGGDDGARTRDLRRDRPAF